MSITRLLIVALLWGASMGLAAGERINLNAADANTLAANIVGIGPARAAAIVEFRDRHGPFKTVDDLLLVKGIGEATLERNRERLTAATR